MNPRHSTEVKLGLVFAFGAYIWWGLLPLYLKALHHVTALEILAHRIVWSALLLALIISAVRRWGHVRHVLRSRRTLGMLLASATLIALNWLTYNWATLNNHLVPASLGYYINPLVNVVLGVIVLGERLRRAQSVAIALAAVGVGLLVFLHPQGVWISIVLALSFGLYGLIRKLAPVDPLTGLFVETLLLAPLALGWLLHLHQLGTGGFGTVDRQLDSMLVLAGFVTTMPLMMFAAAAKRLRYATIGVIQYLTPTMIFLLAVLLYGEPVQPAELVTFGLIWAGLALYAVDSLRAGSAPRVTPPE